MFDLRATRESAHKHMLTAALRPRRWSGAAAPPRIALSFRLVRTVIIEAIIDHGEESGGRAFDALFAIRQAEAIVKALAVAGYEIRRRS